MAEGGTAAGNLRRPALPPLVALVYHRRGVIMRRYATRRWMALLALAGSVAAAAPVAAQVRVPMEFPPPGTRWITRTLDQSGESRLLTTYTVLEPGTFQGRPGFRLDDSIGVQFFERAGRNWFTTVRRGKEFSSASPHNGTFAWPLEVGKTWVAVFQYHDNLRGLRFNRITVRWRVAAEEEVTVPAGTGPCGSRERTTAMPG